MPKHRCFTMVDQMNFVSDSQKYSIKKIKRKLNPFQCVNPEPKVNATIAHKMLKMSCHNNFLLIYQFENHQRL